jgi:hypothetical protein
MDVVVWMRGLGLGKYQATLRDNEIDEMVSSEPGARVPEGTELLPGAVRHDKASVEFLD